MQFELIDGPTDGSRDTLTAALTDVPTDAQKDVSTDNTNSCHNRHSKRCPDRHPTGTLTDRQTASLSHSTHPSLIFKVSRQTCNTTSVCGSRLQWKNNMAMIKDLIKLRSSNILRQEHAVAHAMGYLKLQSVFYFDRHDRWNKKNEKDVYYLFKMISSWKKIQ